MRKHPIKCTSKYLLNGKTIHRYGQCSNCGKSIAAKKAKFCWDCHAKSKPPEVRFWKYVRKTETCWLWTGAVAGSNFYGNFWDGSRYIQTHRYSWIIHHGPIPEGKLVLHKCDTPRCIRPDHLWIGTNAENRIDCVNKNRQAKGGNSGPSKLTDDEARDILLLYNSGVSPTEIARHYSVTRHTVSNIGRRLYWKHIV